MATKAGRATLNKEEFIKKIETNLEEIRSNMDELRELSRANLLSEKELEEAFNNLYDAKDLLDFYANQTKKSENKDALLKSQWNWVRNYMSDLVEFGVGTNAEIRRNVNYKLKSRNGAVVGQGEVIEVRHLPPDQGGRSTIYYNWVEVDPSFWMRDHQADLLDYEQGGPYDQMDYYDHQRDY
jgi:hypothetical protein